ncbi:MAG: hypothetical protein H2054_11040 [Sphingomonas sp.]|jgi:hypothetical protein|nr:hypothetical protein [Sphingomonas sp.]
MTKYQNNSPASTLLAIAFTFIVGTTLMFGALGPAQVHSAQAIIPVSVA